MKVPTNWEDVVDSRDLVKRLAELQELDEPGDDLAAEIDQDLREERRILDKLIQEIRDYAGDQPEDGVTLVRESHFEEYARELHEDTTDLDVAKITSEWPYRHIDWEAAAQELLQDYTSIDWDGVTYYIR